MDDALATNFGNTVLPMVLLCGLVVALPNLAVSQENPSQARLARILLTALLTLVAGAILAGMLYAMINSGTLQQIGEGPLDRVLFFLGRSSLFTLLWAPVLGLVWLVKAQGINRRLGLRMVEGEGSR